jgi:hypothetical protein
MRINGRCLQQEVENPSQVSVNRHKIVEAGVLARLSLAAGEGFFGLSSTQPN